MNALVRQVAFISWSVFFLSVVPGLADSKPDAKEPQEKYVALSAESIRRYWQEHPDASIDAYIKDILERRRIGFLPYKPICEMLHNAGVPDEVISSLRFNIHPDSQFRFVVQKFESSRIPEPVREQLADSIATEYNRRVTTFKDVFPAHAKPPYSPRKFEKEIGPARAIRDGIASHPLLYLTGTIDKVGAIFKATLQLEYTSDSEAGALLIGDRQVIEIRRLERESLTRAASQIVETVYQMLKLELIR